jgi:hypothetical protein
VIEPPKHAPQSRKAAVAPGLRRFSHGFSGT